jgi:hypothetical protein
LKAAACSSVTYELNKKKIWNFLLWKQFNDNAWMKNCTKTDKKLHSMREQTTKAGLVEKSKTNFEYFSFTYFSDSVCFSNWDFPAFCAAESLDFSLKKLFKSFILTHTHTLARV